MPVYEGHQGKSEPSPSAPINFCCLLGLVAVLNFSAGLLVCALTRSSLETVLWMHLRENPLKLHDGAGWLYHGEARGGAGNPTLLAAFESRSSGVQGEMLLNGEPNWRSGEISFTSRLSRPYSAGLTRQFWRLV